MSDVALTTQEPGGMLAELQRQRCKGDSALTTYQGMRFDEVIVLRDAADDPDPMEFVRSVNEYSFAMLEHMYFLPGEFAVEATYSYYAHDYVTQALEGGHAQYWANRGDDPVATRCAAQGLKSMLADPYYEAFVTARQLIQADKRALKRLLKEKRWKDAKAGLRAMDDKLKDLNTAEPLAPRQRLWLKSLRKLRVIDEHEMGAYRAAFEAANPLKPRRRAERDRLRAEREKNDPTYRTVRGLTDMAGLRFFNLGDGGAGPLRAIWPEGPNKNAFVRRVETDQGDRAFVVYRDGGWAKTHLAVLLQEGGALPLGSVTLSKDEYAEIVPAYARG